MVPACASTLLRANRSGLAWPARTSSRTGRDHGERNSACEGSFALWIAVRAFSPSSLVGGGDRVDVQNHVEPFAIAQSVEGDVERDELSPRARFGGGLQAHGK